MSQESSEPEKDKRGPRHHRWAPLRICLFCKVVARTVDISHGKGRKVFRTEYLRDGAWTQKSPQPCLADEGVQTVSHHAREYAMRALGEVVDKHGNIEPVMLTYDELTKLLKDAFHAGSKVYGE